MCSRREEEEVQALEVVGAQLASLVAVASCRPLFPTPVVAQSGVSESANLVAGTGTSSAVSACARANGSKHSGEWDS